MKTRFLLVAIGAILALVSFTVVTVHKPAQAPASKQEQQRPTYRTEPLGGFVAHDRL
jgi:type II secretory pathway component PulL